MTPPFGQVIYGATYDYATYIFLCFGQIIYGAIRYPANAEIDGDSVLVWRYNVKSPARVNFACGNPDIPNFYNKEGLQAGTFTTPDK